MVLLAAAFAVSLIPSAGLFLWLRKQCSDERIADRALKGGMLSTLWALLASFLFNLVEILMRRVFGVSEPVLLAYHKFCVLALAEEIVKFLAMRSVLKKTKPYSYLDVIICMTVVGIGFEIIEAIPYAIGSGPMPMLIRGITLMHGGFGFIIGYYFSKGLRTGKKGAAVFGFLLAAFLHGAYDYTLSDSVLAYSDLVMFIPLGIAAFCLVLVFVIIRFVRKARGQQEYTRLVAGEEQSPAD